MLTEKRQIALPEYRQGESSESRPRLREKVGPPLYRSGAGLRHVPAFCLKPIIKKHPSTRQRPDRSGAVRQRLPSCQRLCHAACRGKTASSPPKALPPSITATYPVCHAACKKTASAPPARMKRGKARRLGHNVLRSGSLYSFRPNPLACKRAARPEYRPCCQKATATRTKTIPRGTG